MEDGGGGKEVAIRWKPDQSDTPQYPSPAKSLYHQVRRTPSQLPSPPPPLFFFQDFFPLSIQVSRTIFFGFGFAGSKPSKYGGLEKIPWKGVFGGGGGVCGVRGGGWGALI